MDLSMNAIVNEIEEEIPKEYRAKLSSLMLGWKTKGYQDHATTSSTFAYHLQHHTNP